MRPASYSPGNLDNGLLTFDPGANPDLDRALMPVGSIDVAVNGSSVTVTPVDWQTGAVNGPPQTFAVQPGADEIFDALTGAVSDFWVRIDTASKKPKSQERTLMTRAMIRLGQRMDDPQLMQDIATYCQGPDASPEAQAWWLTWKKYFQAFALEEMAAHQEQKTLWQKFLSFIGLG